VIPPSPRDDDALANVLVAVIFALVGLSALVSVTGALASWVSGGGWRWTPLPQAGPVLWQLTGDPANPAAAYPPGVREGVPGTFVYWSVAALLIAAVATAVGCGAAAYGRSRPRHADRARWASGRDERRIAVGRDPARRPYRLVAGRGAVTGRLLAAEDCISAVAFGPNGSGKSTGLVAPNVLEWPGSVVMTTTKPQDVALVHAHRAALGPVWLVAPASCPGFPTACWSPVDYAADEESADRMAEWLCEASGMAADVRARAWIAQARKYIKPLLLAANATGGGIEAFVRWVYDGQAAAEEVKAALAQSGFAAARREYTSTWSIHDEGIGSVLFTAYGLADAYSRPSVRVSAQRSDFTAADLVAGRPATLLIVAPESESDRFSPLFTALIASVVHEAEQQAATRGGPLEPRLLLALDEAANVFRFPRLPQLLTTARGNGIQLLLVYHDLGQLEHVYGGRPVARTLLSNAKLRMLLPGVGDLDTLRHFSDILGRTRIEQASTTRGIDGQRTTSRSEGSEDLAPLHLLQQLPNGVAVVQYQNLPPMRVRLRFCYRDRDLRRLAEVPA
jgi:type IV secretion system protein VirD4